MTTTNLNKVRCCENFSAEPSNANRVLSSGTALPFELTQLVLYQNLCCSIYPSNFYQMQISAFYSRRDSTDGKVAALYPEDPGSNPVDSFSMLQHALANNE